MQIIEQPVLIESPAPPGHVAAVADAFRSAGFEVEVEAAIERRGLGDFPWLVRIVVEGTIGGFFAAFGTDAYSGVKHWVRDVWKAREGAGNGTGNLEIVDSEASHLILPSALSDEALDALREIDWSEKSRGYLVWWADRHEWVDHFARD